MANFGTPATDEEKRIWALWKEHGGSQHGPRVEQAYIKYQEFYRFCAAIKADAYRDGEIAGLERAAQWHADMGRKFDAVAKGMEDRPHMDKDRERAGWAGASHAAHATALFGKANELRRAEIEKGDSNAGR